MVVAHTPSHTWSPSLLFVLRPGVETVDFDTNEMIVVKIKSQTPKVPFGTAFSCHVQYVIRANDDRRSARIHASGQVEWSKSCMVKTTITKKIKAREPRLLTLVRTTC